MKLFVDDFRSPPEGWKLARTMREAQEIMLHYEIEELSLDHDLGACEDCIMADKHIGDMETPETTFMNWCPHYEDGTRLVQWMIEQKIWPRKKPEVHSANPLGRARMRALIEQYGPYPAQSPR
jgi:hypothetical protein